MGPFKAPTNIAGKAVGPTGYGMMSLSFPWAPLDYPTAAKLMKTALVAGANFWNGGVFYGSPTSNSLHLLKYYFTEYPEDADKVVLSIKGAYNTQTREPDCSPESIRAEVEAAIRVLDGTKKIDIFQCARVDPKVPIETSLKTLGELVAEGKIGAIGLSEVNALTTRRAHAMHPIAAVEVELSLFSTDPITQGLVATCQELGIAVVAYSPLSRGFLSSDLRSFEDLSKNDFRHHLPRFQASVFDQNRKLVDAVEVIAKRKGLTPGQIGLAWVRNQGAIPIPGTTKIERVVENCKEAFLTDEEMEEIQTILDRLPIQGQRYGGEFEKLLNQ